MHSPRSGEIAEVAQRQSVSDSLDLSENEGVRVLPSELVEDKRRSGRHLKSTPRSRMRMVTSKPSGHKLSNQKVAIAQLGRLRISPSVSWGYSPFSRSPILR
jgi:hypothetical protein